MKVFPRQRARCFVVGLLLLTSTLTLIQVEIATPSYGQSVAQTTCTPGSDTSGEFHTGNRTWTNLENRTLTWSDNATWGHGGNRSWTHGFNQTWPCFRNEWPHKGAEVPGLAYGWARSNITVAARNLTLPILMNGTQGVRLGFIGINATSNGQMIRRVAFNETVVQIEFDRNGSILLAVNSSVAPSEVFADGDLLSEAQTLNGLTSQSDVWVYESDSHALTVFADPTSITLIYTPTSGPMTTPVPEYPTTTLYLVLIGSLIISIVLTNNSKTRTRPPARSLRPSKQRRIGQAHRI